MLKDNEEFFKISGELPPNLLINKTGLIYGIVNRTKKKKKHFILRIGVRRNDEVNFNKRF